MDTLSPLQATKPASNTPANAGRRRDQPSRFVHNAWYVAMPVIEAQQTCMDQPEKPLKPALLSIDAGPIACRKVLDRLLSEDG